MNPTSPTADERSVPLTPEQQRIWRAEQAGFDSATHLIGTARRLTGPLQPAAMAEALAAVVARHDALRMAIRVEAGSPVQSLGDSEAIGRLALADFSSLPEDGREAAAREWTDEFLRRPLRLDTPPLLRVGLARLADDDHLLLFCAHHLMVDADSLAIVRHELLATYQSFVEAAKALPRPTVSFLAYAASHAARDSQRVTTDSAYWRGHLTGTPPPATLPPDLARQGRLQTRGARVTLPLPPELASALAQTARRHRCTLFNVVHLALAVVLARRSGQSTVVIGTPAADRDQPELERAVGMFGRLLALRIDLPVGATLRDLLMRTRTALLGGLTHRHLPYDEISDPHNVFRVLLITDPSRPDKPPPPGLRIAPAYKPSPAVRFDLTVLYAPETPKLYADYDTSLYRASTVEGFLRELATVLQAVAQDADTLVNR